MITVVRVICLTILLSAFSFRAAAEDITNAIHAYLQQYVEAEKINAGIVVGIVDEHGSRIVSCGKMDDGTDREVNGDTLFQIGSITKTFTGLLLQDTVERGEMKLDDPVAKYLPKSVKMPTHNGKQITLLQLATHTSGLPPMPDNFDPKRADNPYADYTVEKMYAFLSGCKLIRDPGVKWEYSSLGMALLGQAIALKAGTNYESLVVDRICQPLNMDSTRITLTPELKSRFATGHNQSGYAVSSTDFGAMMGGAALRSTANDLLKYVSANLGLTPSSLTPLMEKTHAVHFQSAIQANVSALAWFADFDPQGREILWHGGSTYGFSTFAGFDKTRRRGVVVLSNSRGVIDVNTMGKSLLESEGQSDRRPTETNISSQVYGSYVGQYQRSPDFAQRMLLIWQFLLNAPKAAVYIPTGFCLAVLVVLLWRAGSFRNRCIILSCAVLVSGLLAALIALVSMAREDFLLKTANERIASIRKAPAQIRVVDSKGSPVAGATVRVEQRRHSFLFGCNAFRFYYCQDERNQLYAARFSALFNYATLPFYWELYEPEKGDTTAYDKKTKRLAEWFKAYHIETKGHPLVWHGLYPKWAPSDPDPTRDALHQRIATIISEFKSDIRRWDVVNEATVARNFTNGVGYWAKRDGPATVVETALRWAHEADAGAELVYNDYNLGREHRRLIGQLVKDNAPFQVVGLQSHMHQMEWPLEYVWDKCESYSKFGKAIHFTEVTVVSGKHGWELPQPWPTTPEGERRQADYVERLYTLLFSHPAVQAITWWDLQDGAWQGAPGGLLRADLTTKPAYDRLLKLIHETWWTRESLSSNEKGVCTFVGFLGDYEVTVHNGDLSRTVKHTLVKGTNDWTVTLEHEKTSDRQPIVSESPNPHVAIKLDTRLLDACVGQPPKPHVAIKLDGKLLDACVGHYEFAPDAVSPTGVKLTIWREGDQLVGQAWGKNILQGAFDIYPESETNFFLKIDGAQLTFIKNDKGEVTAVIHHQAAYLDNEGKKLKE
jgi:CubicO group peptidase (beta-lactamase class C family)/GH35 family endo-1,4-beta-xylanase